MEGPDYPAVQGQPVPDLGLARYGVAGVATAQTMLHTNSDSTPPVSNDWPQLESADPAGSIHKMGIVAGVPEYDLCLANEFEVRTPAQLAAAQGIGGVNTPSFSAPTGSVPTLRAGALSRAELDMPEPLAADPALADLTQFAQPGGLSIVAASSDLTPLEWVQAESWEHDRPAGLSIAGGLQVDPLLPDLQDPQLEQDVYISDRPGDLASGALAEMAEDASYKRLPDHAYQALWMQQAGDNQRRERHLGMLYLGLEREEGGGR
ncbi:MAG TPA: hypothetical protein VGD98_23265 [Ktedonobacteraceae bacterium]